MSHTSSGSHRLPQPFDLALPATGLENAREFKDIGLPALRRMTASGDPERAGA